MCFVAHFSLNETVNKQNFYYCALENPKNTQTRPLNLCAVWYAIAPLGVVNQYFLEHNSNCCHEKCIFLQDGANACTIHVSIKILRNVFSGHNYTFLLISLAKTLINSYWSEWWTISSKGRKDVYKKDGDHLNDVTRHNLISISNRHARHH